MLLTEWQSVYLELNENECLIYDEFGRIKTKSDFVSIN